VWNVGPYTLRAMGSFTQSHDDGSGRGKKRANGFLIGHDLFLWSPKGFLTGSATTPGSVLVGTHFERASMSLDCATGGCTGGHLPQFHRNRILLREWDLWYFIAPRMSMGINVLWYDAANLDNRVGQAGYNLGFCSKTGATTTDCRRGAGGDWLDVLLNWRYTF